jgi:hypothetical protein
MRTIPTETYYTSLEHYMNVFDETARSYALSAREYSEYAVWKANVRNKLVEISGINRMNSCDLLPRQLESVQLAGYRREKWIIQTEPDVWMPFYILLPDKKIHDRNACVIAPHGHGSGGKFAVAGRRDIPAVDDAINEYNYDYGVQFVQQGYTVFCPDARGFGERRELTKQSDHEASFMSSSCVELNHIAICLGRTLTGMWVWDLMRLIDYVETREDCDSSKIGCAGLSGGGMQTLWLAAMDDRIRCAAVSGYLYGYKDSLLKQSWNCGCNYVPHLWEYVDMGDIGALIAPRPLIIETGTVDSLNGDRGVANASEQVEIIRSAYALFGREDQLYHHIFEGGHLWNGKETFRFMDTGLSIPRGND